MLERLLKLKVRPPELNAWNDVWFEAHRVFAYETFLYVIAALMKTGAYGILKLIFKSHYLSADTAGYGSGVFGRFDAFYGHSETLQILAGHERKLYAPAAELIKRQADRTDLPFAVIIQAELLVLMMAFIDPKCRWYPQTLHYSSQAGGFPFFVRAAQHRNFRKLAEVTGILSADALRESVRKGQERLRVTEWHDFWLEDQSFWSSMNMDALDTLN